jgi:meckelin
VIKEKTYFEQLWGANPDMSQGLVFFPDETGFKSLLMYGLEWHLLVLYITLFGLIDITLNSAIKSGIIVYFIDLVVRWTRQYYGVGNISRKSLMDVKFLL